MGISGKTAAGRSGDNRHRAFGRSRSGFLAVACILAVLVSCATGARKEERTHFSIVGRWEGVDRTGKRGAFCFSDKGEVTIIIDGKPLDGSEAGGFGVLRYTIDCSKDPAPLDIIGIDRSGAERGRVLMIVRFITRDRIKIRTFYSEERPPNFDRESVNDTIILDRQAD
jgi:hypothetical protein